MDWILAGRRRDRLRLGRVRLVEGRTDFLNGFIVPKGFRSVPSSVAPLASGGAALDEFAACGKERLLELQDWFGFRSFRKALAVQRALDSCFGTGGCTSGGQDESDAAADLCRLLGPYLADMGDIHSVVAMGVLLRVMRPESENVSGASGSLPSAGSAHAAGLPRAVLTRAAVLALLASSARLCDSGCGQRCERGCWWRRGWLLLLREDPTCLAMLLLCFLQQLVAAVVDIGFSFWYGFTFPSLGLLRGRFCGCSLRARSGRCYLRFLLAPCEHCGCVLCSFVSTQEVEERNAFEEGESSRRSETVVAVGVCELIP